MSYKSTSDLPASVRDNLPKHAQEIYMKAFNNAWDEYSDSSKRRGDSTKEETAHRVAWSAVKKEYEKNEKSGKWHAKKSNKD